MVSYTKKLLSLCICVVFLTSCVENLKVPNPFDSTDKVQAWTQSLQGKSSAEQVELAKVVLDDRKSSKALKDRATYILASRYNAESKNALESLENLYLMMDNQGKIKMEETLYFDLQASANDDLKQLLKLITPDLEAKYPYSLVIFVSAKRNLLNDSALILKTLTSPQYFMSPMLNGQPTDVATTTSTPTSGKIAILLPQSGNIAPVAQQIMAGVRAGRSYLQEKGINLEVHFIDTSKADWLTTLKALPRDCVTVGGPIQIANYNVLKDNNILRDRAFFTFTPRLSTVGDEGVLAWQFFTKPEDQINAVLNTASNDLGITSFGVFAPNTSYGSNMDNLFTQIAVSRGFRVESAFYSTEEIKEWTNTSKDFLQATAAYSNDKLPTVNAPFDAIFFPASWRNMDQLISTMHYHGAIHKVMLGTSLWEQSLNQPQKINPTTFGLTLFPISYEASFSSPQNESFKSLLSEANVKAGDWSALGFDFILMSARLNLTTRLSAPMINSRLQGLQVEYVGAPFKWDALGIAQRQLFIAQPSRSGHVYYDSERFKNYRQNGGTLPNQEESVLTEEMLQQQEENARNEVDSLVDSILNN